MSVTVAAIVVGIAMGYTFIAGMTYALLPVDFGSEKHDRHLCSWAWPVVLVMVATWRTLKRVYIVPRALFRLPARLRSSRRLPKARVVK